MRYLALVEFIAKREDTLRSAPGGMKYFRRRVCSSSDGGRIAKIMAAVSSHGKLKCEHCMADDQWLMALIVIETRERLVSAVRSLADSRHNSGDLLLAKKFLDYRTQLVLEIFLRVFNLFVHSHSI